MGTIPPGGIYVNAHLATFFRTPPKGQSGSGEIDLNRFILPLPSRHRLAYVRVESADNVSRKKGVTRA